MSKLSALAAAVALSIITVAADYFVKKASLSASVWNRWLAVGAVIYGSTAIGWVFVMRGMKLSALGVVYGVCCIIFLTLTSLVVFHEKITLLGLVGVILGIVSILLLYKFA